MGRNTIKEFRLQEDLRNNVVVDDKHRAYALMTSERAEIWDESYGGLSSPVKTNVKVETPSSTTSVWDGRESSQADHSSRGGSVRTASTSNNRGKPARSRGKRYQLPEPVQLDTYTYGRFGHLSTKIDENTNSNYSFNFQYIEILSDQTLENSNPDILIWRILIFWEIEWVKQSNVSNRFD